MFAALQDCCRPLIATKHLADHLTLLDQFNDEMTKDFQQVICMLTCAYQQVGQTTCTFVHLNNRPTSTQC